MKKKQRSLLDIKSSSENYAFPHETEIEKAVLAALILENTSVHQAFAADVNLCEADFYAPSHQTIFKAIYEIYANGELVDMLTVERKLKEMNMLELAGGKGVTMRITMDTASSANLIYHIRILQQTRVARQVKETAMRIMNESITEQDGFKLLKSLEDQTKDIADNVSTSSVKITTMREKQNFVLEQNQNGIVNTIYSKFGCVNNYTFGYEPGDVVILGGKSGMGKTAYVLQEVEHLAAQGMKVGFISLEMTPEKLAKRLIISRANQMGLNFTTQTFKSVINTEHYRQVQDDIAKSGVLDNIVIPDKRTYADNESVEALMNLLVHVHGCQAIVIDYVQLMYLANGKGGDGSGLTSDLVVISRRIMEFAKRTDTLVFVLSQLSRSVDAQENEKYFRFPQVHHLKYSSQLEHDADHIMLFYYPWNYLPYRGMTINIMGIDFYVDEQTYLANVAKVREGRLGIAEMSWNPKNALMNDIGASNSIVRSTGLTPLSEAAPPPFETNNGNDFFAFQ